MWYDDPIFDDAIELVGSVALRGDAWRRLQALKEESGEPVHIIKVAGTSFRAAAIRAAMNAGVGAAELVAEPTNAHDSNAFMVMLGGHHVGYIPRGSAVPTGRLSVVSIGVPPCVHVWLASFT